MDIIRATLLYTLYIILIIGGAVALLYLFPLLFAIGVGILIATVVCLVITIICIAIYVIYTEGFR